MQPSEKLQQMDLALPEVAQPVGSYTPAVASGHLIFTAGQLPSEQGRLVAAGKVPADVPLELAQRAARTAVLNAIAAAARSAGGIDNINRVVRMNVFVNSSPGFVEQAKVANAASELIGQIFDSAGLHTRCAIGAAELPLNAPVEIDLIVESRG
ncbi:MAG: RidA family protein [Phycisphaerae bacterium]